VALSLAAALTITLGPTACSGDDGSVEAFCAEIEALPSLESVLSRFSEADPQQLADSIDRARASYEDLASAAPSEIRDETEAVVALVDDVLDAVERHPDDPKAAADALRSTMDDHPDVEQARTAVASYAEAECEVELDPTLGTTTTTTPGG
jgi:hypothetical protein